MSSKRHHRIVNFFPFVWSLSWRNLDPYLRTFFFWQSWQSGIFGHLDHSVRGNCFVSFFVFDVAPKNTTRPLYLLEVLSSSDRGPSGSKCLFQSFRKTDYFRLGFHCPDIPRWNCPSCISFFLQWLRLRYLHCFLNRAWLLCQAIVKTCHIHLFRQYGPCVSSYVCACFTFFFWNSEWSLLASVRVVQVWGVLGLSPLQCTAKQGQYLFPFSDERQQST